MPTPMTQSLFDSLQVLRARLVGELDIIKANHDDHQRQADAFAAQRKVAEDGLTFVDAAIADAQIVG